MDNLKEPSNEQKNEMAARLLRLSDGYINPDQPKAIAWLITAARFLLANYILDHSKDKQ